MNRSTWKKIIKNKLFIIAALIFFPPLGIILMWKYTDWTVRTKTILSSLAAFILIIVLVSAYNAPPSIQVGYPSDTDTIRVSTQTYAIEGRISMTHAPILTINNREVPIASDGTFTYSVELKDGDNIFTLVARSEKGETRERITVHLSVQNPQTNNNNSSKPDKTLYQVVSITDGDTIKVRIDGNTQTIRFIGFDTPETKDPDKPVQCYGKEATSRMQHYVQSKSVRLQADSSQGDKDKYGRLLRYVFLEDNTHVGLQMIKEGYAREYTYSKPYIYQNDFTVAQVTAKANGIGLWAASTCAGTTTQVSPVEASTPSAPQPAAASPQASAPATTHTPSSSDTSSYPSCKAARTAGVTPLYRGQPGYGSHLDGDGDGVACE